MKFSARSRYGLRLLLRLAMVKDHGTMQLSEISRVEGISEKYLGQIVIQLKSRGMVLSVRGALGGYYLSRDPSRISVREAVEALDGPLDRFESEETAEDPQSGNRSTRKLWTLLTSKIRETLDGVSLADLAEWYRDEAESFVYEI